MRNFIWAVLGSSFLCFTSISQHHIGFGAGFCPQYAYSKDVGVKIPALLAGYRGFVELGYALPKHFRFAMTGGIGYQRYYHEFDDGHVPISTSIIRVSTEKKSSFYFLSAQVYYFKRVTRWIAVSFGAGPIFNNTQLTEQLPPPIMVDTAELKAGPFYEDVRIEKQKEWNTGLTLNLDIECWLGKKGHAMYANFSHEAYFQPQVFWNGLYSHRESSTGELLYSQPTTVTYRGNRFNFEVGYRYYFRTRKFRRWSSYSGR